MPKQMIEVESEDKLALNPFEDRPVRRVLIVEEEGSARRELERSFRALGVATEAVSDLRQVEQVAAPQAPDLVLMELGPVAAPGLAMINTLRHRLPATRFVVATSYGSVASAVRAMQSGVDLYLCRPVTATQILEALGNEIDSLPEDRPAPMMTLDQAIWEYLHHTVEMTGSVAEAARRLGLWRQSLRRMLNKYRPAGAGPSLLR